MSNLEGPVDELLRRGTHGPDVEKLQASLNRLGYDVKPDGRFGSETAAAVRHLQRSSGVSDDGVVGPTTNAVIERQTAANYHAASDWHASVEHEHHAPPSHAHDAAPNGEVTAEHHADAPEACSDR